MCQRERGRERYGGATTLDHPSSAATLGSRGSSLPLPPPFHLHRRESTAHYRSGQFCQATARHTVQVRSATSCVLDSVVGRRRASSTWRAHHHSRPPCAQSCRAARNFRHHTRVQPIAIPRRSSRTSPSWRLNKDPWFPKQASFWGFSSSRVLAMSHRGSRQRSSSQFTGGHRGARLHCCRPRSAQRCKIQSCALARQKNTPSRWPMRSPWHCAHSDSACSIVGEP